MQRARTQVGKVILNDFEKVLRLLTVFSGRVGSLRAATRESEVGQKD